MTERTRAANEIPRDLSPERKRAFETASPPQKKAISDREIVQEMLVAIRCKRDAGWSYEAIRQQLAEKLGFKGTRQTLYNYVWRFTKKLPSRTADGRSTALQDQPPLSPAATPERRTVRETLCGLQPDPPAADDSPSRTTLVEKLNRPV